MWTTSTRTLFLLLTNDSITVTNIPPEALLYSVRDKPAIAWVMDQQGIVTDKASGILNNANIYAIETMGDPAYSLKLLARVIRISVETVRIINGLPEPGWQQ